MVATGARLPGQHAPRAPGPSPSSVGGLDQAAGPQVARALYAAFARRDGAGMAALYAADASFSDPVFPHLRGAEVGAMWRMLCERGQDLRVEAAAPVPLADGGVQVAWQAWYTFPSTRRPVHNRVTATLRIAGGRIMEHRDQFDFPAWARQALGWKGRLLGHTRLLRRRVQAQASRSLAAFCARDSQPPVA